MTENTELRNQANQQYNELMNEPDGQYTPVMSRKKLFKNMLFIALIKSDATTELTTKYIDDMNKKLASPFTDKEIKKLGLELVDDGVW